MRAADGASPSPGPGTSGPQGPGSPMLAAGASVARFRIQLSGSSATAVGAPGMCRSKNSWRSSTHSVSSVSPAAVVTLTPTGMVKVGPFVWVWSIARRSLEPPLPCWPTQAYRYSGQPTSWIHSWKNQSRSCPQAASTASWNCGVTAFPCSWAAR